MLRSAICRRDHFDMDWYANAARVFGYQPGVMPRDEGRLSYRKIWEWCAIFEVLQARGMLAVGKRGLGFAVGTEPLPSVMASRGVDVLATDIGGDDVSSLWSANGQHASSLDSLFHPNLVNTEAFKALVKFAPLDMRDLSSIPTETYDYVWSSCALEHIGSLQDGWRFILDAMRLVKPGGIAVHTTEFNLSSNERTITSRECLYRRRDIEELDHLLRPMRCGLEAVDWDCGAHPDDLDYDVEPFFLGTSPHIKLMLGGYVTTSMVLVIRKSY